VREVEGRARGVKTVDLKQGWEFATMNRGPPFQEKEFFLSFFVNMHPLLILYYVCIIRKRVLCAGLKDKNKPRVGI
jgi:hypothetical protein